MWQEPNSLCRVPEDQQGLAGPGGCKYQGGARSKTDMRYQNCCPGRDTASGIWSLSKFAYICIHCHFHRRALLPGWDWGKHISDLNTTLWFSLFFSFGPVVRF